MICVCVLFLHISYNVLMDTMHKGRVLISFYLHSFYSAFFDEDCEEIVVVLIFFCWHYIIAYVYSHSDL